MVLDERLIESLPAEYLASSIEFERSQNEAFASNGHQEDELQESYRSKTITIWFKQTAGPMVLNKCLSNDTCTCSKNILVRL